MQKKFELIEGEWGKIDAKVSSLLSRIFGIHDFFHLDLLKCLKISKINRLGIFVLTKKKTSQSFKLNSESRNY